jgi:two-component system, OmpR family, response regulator
LETLYFSGFEFHSSENRVIGATGSCVKLTALENQLLLYFSSNPYVLCTRIEIAEKLYGRHRPSDRAVDILVTRLRKKLSRLSSTQPIRTEYRRGYVFEGEVSARPEAEQC